MYAGVVIILIYKLNSMTKKSQKSKSKSKILGTIRTGRLNKGPRKEPRTLEYLERKTKRWARGKWVIWRWF
jgi:hypothetical protein